MVNTTFPSDVNLDDQGEQEPREECGVFGVWAPGEDVAKLSYFGLFALQHRARKPLVSASVMETASLSSKTWAWSRIFSMSPF